MEPCKEPVSVRVTRLNNFFLGRNGNAGNTLLSKQFIGREGLLDALIVLYDECNNDILKKDKNIAKFIEKFRGVVSELRRLRVNLADFEVKKVIGRGHFGEVQVVREKQTGDVYAMKTLRKSDTLSQQGAAFYQEERDIMAQTNSEWLTFLQYAFQDMNNLYLVMEFHPGGDLLALLERFDGAISEDMAKFYSAELAMAIHSLHNMGYVHRDIKPDNILIDRCGHLKLADFGSSARLTAAGVVTSQLPVGTPEYVAPEVLQSLEQNFNGKGNKQGFYGRECDYWSLGVVTYEMVIGRTPFSGDQLSATYNNIMCHHNSLQFPDDVKTSPNFQLLVSELLQDSASRLNHEKILKHNFFNCIDWTRLRDSAPPFVPIVTSEDDTSNFVEFEHEPPTPSIENFKSRKEFCGKNLPFIGFTYTHDSTQNKLLESSVISEKEQNSSTEAILAAKKKEIEDLYRKLQESQQPQKLGEMNALERKLEECSRRLQTVEDDRSQLEIALEKFKKESQSLKRTLTLEREDRKMLEANAITMIRDSKARWEKKRQEEQQELLKCIEEKEKEIAGLNMEKEALQVKVKHLEEKWKASCKEAEQLQNFIEQNKNKVAEVREKTRMSIAGVETHLQKVVSDKQKQILNLQEQLEAYMKHSRVLEDRLDEIETSSGNRVLELTTDYEKLQAENSQLCQTLQQNEEKYFELQSKIEDQMKQKSSDNSTILELETKVSQEQKNNSKLKEQLNMMQKELIELKQVQEKTLSVQTVRLEDHHSVLSSVESELKDSVRIQVDLQKKLQVSSEKYLNSEAEKNNLSEKLFDSQKIISQLERESNRLKEQIKSSSENKHISCNHEVVISEMTQQKSFLEIQIEKLESQLEKSRETLVLERDNAKTVQSQLWKKEKECSDAKIDLRIAQREARTAEQELKALQEEKSKWAQISCEERNAHAQEVRANWEKIESLHEELKSLRYNLEQKQEQIFELTKKLEAEKNSQMEGNRKLEDVLMQLKSAQGEISSGKRVTKSLESQVSSLLSEVENLKRNVELSTTEKERLQKQLEEQKNNCHTFQMNVNVLKETCGMLEEQLEEFDKVLAAYNEREKKNTVEITKLQGEIETLQADLRSARQATNEEKSYKIRAETKLQQVEAEVKSQCEFIDTLQAQLQDYKQLAETLTEQVAVLENACGESEVSLRAVKRHLESQQVENNGLKEEMAQLLTTIHSLRESSFKLSRELEEASENNRELENRLAYLQTELDEQRSYHRNREIKTDATIQQQTKLIDFLQHNLSEHSKKKKTLTDKLFGRQKENVAPKLVPNFSNRDLEVQLAQERGKVKMLSEQLEDAKVQLQNSSKKVIPYENIKEKVTIPTSPNSRRVLSHIVQSPGTQQRSNFERQPSLQRMHHNIPHRFEPKLCMRVTKCAVCLDSIHFGRHAAVCQECEATAHPKCSLAMPTTCGLPSGFMRHFSRTWINKENTNTDQKPSGSACVESFVKLPNSGNSGWAKHYLRLHGTVLEIFSNKPVSKEEKPDATFNLCPPEGSPRVLSAVPCSDVLGTASSDMPYILKVEIVPRTTCWPKNSSLLIMALSFPDKQKWVQALEAVVQQSCGQLSGIGTYSGQCVITFDRAQNPLMLDVNCSVELSEQVLLLGAEEGLYSLKMSGRKGTALPVHIHGPTHVHQIATIPFIGLSIMITGENRCLVQCDLHQLISAAEAAECAHPSVTTRAIIPSTTPPTCCHLFAVSPSSNGHNGDVVLCVATSDKLILLKWNFKETSFIPVKMLETADPCSCIHFTAHSVIVGCNKFFELDLQNFSVEEFLDSSDKTLAHTIVGTQQLNSFPVAILDITSHKSSGSSPVPEFLLCFNELGVFVDQYGRRSREDDIKWSHLPLAFVYQRPYIFIVHFMSIEIMKLTPLSFTREQNDTSSTVNYPDQIFVELNNPRFLGLSKVSSAIYLSTMQSGAVSVLYLDATLACKDDLTLSLIESDGADLNNCGSVDFSFTSSLVQSLDGALDSESNPSDSIAPFSGAHRVRFDSTPHTAL